MISFEEYRNAIMLDKIKEMFGPHGDIASSQQDPSVAATTWFSNSRFAPGLRQKLTKKLGRRKLRGKML